MSLKILHFRLRNFIFLKLDLHGNYIVIIIVVVNYHLNSIIYYEKRELKKRKKNYFPNILMKLFTNNFII